MKHLFVRLAIVVLLVATAFGVAPQASAQDGAPAIRYASIGWLTECSATTGVGWVLVEYAFDMAPGYTVEWYYTEFGSAFDYSAGGSYVATSSGTWATAFDWYVPYDGFTYIYYDVYAPNGLLVSSSEFYANCVTGELWSPYGDVYGINEPAASARVLGTVLADTPVYSEASPTAALKPVLKAGQTWFIVGQTTGTDGALWYKVFVGGANMGYVPAAVMAPQGPVPGAK